MASLADQRTLSALLDKFAPKIKAAFLAAMQDLRDGFDLRAVIERLQRGDVAGAVKTMNIEEAAMTALETAVKDTYSTAGASMTQTGKPAARTAEGMRLIVRFGVRDTRSEDILRRMSARLVTGIIAEQRENIRAALTDGMAAGLNPRDTASSIAGKIDPTTGKRAGGLVGLSAPQARTVSKVRAGFASGEPEALEHYLTLKTRDKRFDGTVREALRQGRKLDKPDADRIIARLSDRYLKLRADTIARTETLAAMNAAKHEAFAKGLAKTKYGPDQVIRTWDSAGDDRVRHTHAEMDGQQVRGLDTAFVSPSGARLRFPGDATLGAGPEEIINCRCIVNYRIDVFARRAP